MKMSMSKSNSTLQVSAGACSHFLLISAQISGERQAELLDRFGLLDKVV